VLAHRSHQKSPIDLIEETRDIEIEHPIPAPAPLSSHGESVVG
jgi:hypothetical protein